MKKAIFIALFFVLNLTIVKAQFEFKYRKLTTEDGLPSNTIYSICEDKKGNIVLGTDNGIAIFNGNQFNNLNINNGLSRPYVVASTADKNGTVWAVSYFGQLQKLVNNKIINTNISTSYYNEILTTGNEILLFNRFNRLPNNMGYQYLLLTTSGKQKQVNQSYNFRTKMVLPFYVQNNEKIEIVNNNIVYKAYRIPLPTQISLLHKIIFRKNDVCLLDDNFLFIVDFNGKILSQIKIPMPLTASFKTNTNSYNFSFITDNNENCWLNIQKKGLFMLQNKTWVNISNSLNLSSEQNINFLYGDKKGQVWIATHDEGLYCIPSTLIQSFKSSTAENFFNGFAFSQNKKRLFISTRFNLYSFENDKLSHVNKYKGDIKVDDYNQAPVLLIQYNLAARWDKKLGLFIVAGRQLLKTDKTGAYVLTVSPQLVRFKNGVSKSLLSANDATEKVNNVVYHKNQYYFNNSEKINIRKFDDNSLSDVRDLKVKITGFISDFTFINDTMWVSANKKVYKLINEKIVDSIEKINNVQIGEVRKIKNIGKNTFLCSSSGLFIINENRKFFLNKYNFLPSNEVSNVTVFGDELFVATKEGLAKIDLEIFNSSFSKPIFEVFKGKGKVQNEIKLDHSEDQFSLNLVIQTNNHPKNQVINYKIDNQDWIQNPNENINFQSLAYGSHQLSVRVRDVNSDWSTQTFKVYRNYPFYLKWWFVLAAALIIIALVWFLYYRQVNKLKLKQSQEIFINNKILELRQSALAAMMNPHFIFNSLNAVQYYINSQQGAKASEHLAKLARLVRLFLSQAAEPFITVADEIKRLQIYLELEQIRFNNFNFQITVGENIKENELKIPNMVLQPFIENAILHGVSHLQTNDGLIDLKFSLNEDVLTIDLTDNGLGISQNNHNNSEHVSKALHMIKERLDILQQTYPDKIFSLTYHTPFPEQINKGHQVLLRLSVFNQS